MGPITSHRYMDERQGQAAGTVFLFCSGHRKHWLFDNTGLSRNVVLIIVVQEEDGEETTRNGNLIHDMSILRGKVPGAVAHPLPQATLSPVTVPGHHPSPLAFTGAQVRLTLGLEDE